MSPKPIPHTMRHLLLLALSLFTGCASNAVHEVQTTQGFVLDERAVTERTFFEQVDLFVAGQNGVNTYRIPALAKTNAGTLLAVCDARQDDSSDLPGNIDIVLRRSTDHGRTWGPIATIADFPTSEGAGDPSVIVDRNTGRVFCFYAYGPPGIGFFNSQAGSSNTTDPNTLHAHVITSDDDGLTWSAHTDLNPQIKDAAWAGIFASSGHGIQTRAGRLIQPYVVREVSGLTSARNAYSDDGGATWSMGAAAGFDVNESKLVERNDGSIVQNMRHNSINARFTAVSTDGGVTFGPMTQDAVLIDPRVNASYTVQQACGDGDPSDVLLFTNPRTTGSRTNMTVQSSLDEGATWPTRRVIHKGPAAYSSLAPINPELVGLFYERGENSPVEAITFARFSLSWIGEDPAPLLAGGRPNPNDPELWAWFDASATASAGGPGPDQDGDPISRWNDVSGGGYHHLPRSTGGAGVFRANALNGRPAIDLPGNADIWGAANAGGEFQTVPNPYTVLCVARVRSITGDHYVFDKSTNAGGLALRAHAASPPRWQVQAGRTFSGPSFNAVLASAPVIVNQYALHRVTVDGDQVTHHVNGTLAASGTLPDGGVRLQQGGLILGADVGTNNDAACDVAEVLVYSRALSDAGATAIEAYLLDKYVP